MVPRGDDIDAEIEHLTGHIERQTEAAGSVFAVDHHQVDHMLVDESPELVAEDPPAAAADDVSDE